MEIHYRVGEIESCSEIRKRTKLYEYSTNQAPSEELAVIKKSKTYGTPVVNKGESFIYTDGKWTDWSEFELPLPEDFPE